MKFLKIANDGGKDSGVKGLFLIEIKSLFSICLLKFSPNNRENFHSHAFNALTWWIKGSVVESFPDKENITWKPSLKPKYTPKTNIHKIHVEKPAYCLSIRGPWDKQWYEVNTTTNSKITLKNGREVIQTITFREN